MNFVINLLKLNSKNVILTVINYLSKERHYILYSINENNTSVKWNAQIIIQNVFQLHRLSAFIISDCESQFVFIMWKTLWKRLFINVYLSTAFYPQINEQSEWVNQDIESYL